MRLLSQLPWLTTLCLVSPAAAVQENLAGWEGNHQLGLRFVGTIGDLDGDGVSDLLMGNAALVQAVSSKTFEVLWEQDLGTFPGEWGGIHGIGDFDGDGVPDVLLTSGAADFVNNFGKVRILSGATGERIVTLHGDLTNELMGWDGCGIGDVDGDGFEDILVASRGGGRVRVFGGPEGHLIRMHFAQHPAHTRPSVAAVGDVDGDGVPDYVIGWPQNTNEAVTVSATGRVTLYSGADGSEIFSVYGDTGWGGGYAGDHLGRTVTGMGDVNGDGVPDFAAGAPGTLLLSNGFGPGYVRIYSGADGQVLLHLDPQKNQAGVTTFGYLIRGGLDLSGDGVPDLLVGQPGDNAPGVTTGIQGALNAICGRTGVRLWRLYGTPGSNDRFGQHFAILPDVTGDGLGDFLACNPEWKNEEGVKVGKVWLYAGARGGIERFCPGAPNSTGVTAELDVVGALGIGNDELRLKISGAVPGNTALFFLAGAEQPPLPFGEGSLCLAPPIQRLTPATIAADGTLLQHFPFGEGPGATITPGSMRSFQTWYRDPAAPAAFNLSDALRVVFPP